ncbi:MAG: histidine phosphatase family protein, partial [Thermodesulfobacteriota bacterium]
MQLILIRHGKTDWNELEKCQGSSDIPLNKNGINQAEKLAHSLRNEKLDYIYSSDLSRARITAEKIAGYHNIEIKIDHDFREMDQGDFEGLEFKYIREKYSHVLKEWRTNPETLTIPGGESLTEVQDRAYKSVMKLLEKHYSKTVLVVSHNLTIVTLICKFSNMTLKNFRDFIVGETSKTIIN